MAQMLEKILLATVVVVLITMNMVFISGTTVFIDEENEEEAKEKSSGSITRAEAIALALDKAPGTVAEVETDMVNGNVIYEVEIVDANTETEVRIDAATGVVMAIEQEPREEDEEEAVTEKERQQIKIGPITEQKAIKIALGLVNGHVVSVETEREHGMLIYEVEIAHDGDVVEIEIDAATGEILEMEWEDD